MVKICPEPNDGDMAELSEGEIHSVGKPGDHIRNGIVEDETGMWVYIGNERAWIGDEHIEAFHQVLHERAAKVGIELGE